MTKEEYLLRYEDQILVTLDEHYAAAGKSVFLMYSTAIVDLLFEQGYIRPALFGMTLDSDTLEDARRSFATFAPLALSFALCYCAYSIFIIRKVLGRISRNAYFLRRENPDARPVTIGSVRLRRAGLVGLWLYLARKSVKVFGTKDTQTTPRFLLGCVVLSCTVVYVALVFLLPALAIAWVFFDAPIDDARHWWVIGTLSGAACLVVAVVVTLVLRYLDEYMTESGRWKFSDRFRSLIERASSLVTKWLKDDEDIPDELTRSASQGQR